LVLIVGAAGQLGEVTAALFARRGPTRSLTRAELDLTNHGRVLEIVDDLRPSTIINCSGYNQVDAAEDEYIAAIEANAFVVRSLAKAANRVGAGLVHYSTDFVFDGDASTPYRETDRPNPRSVYAASKLMGEWFAADAPQHYVLRVESLFGGLTRRKGSLDRMIDAIQAGQPVRAFTDRVVSPSYVWDIAIATATLLARHAPAGLYHCVNSGSATWYAVAEEIQRQLQVEATLEPSTMQVAALKAARPRYCALANDKLSAAGYPMPTWQDALSRAIAARQPSGQDALTMADDCVTASLP